MLRRVLIGVAVAAVAGSGSSDLMACGDKFLRVGRSARTRGYGAVYPASILIYTPNATTQGLREFESLLKKAGHKPTAIRDGALLPQALSSAKFDVVIADYADAVALQRRFQEESAHPGLLPILHRPSEPQEKEASRQFHCLLKPEKMTKYDALIEIDHVMELRRKAKPVTANAK